jgi:two-component system OmpR family sensor kinase
MFSSLRWPLALAFLGLTTMCVGGTELVVFRAVRENYLATVQENLNRDCTFVADLMSRHMDSARLSTAERKIITDEMGRLSLRFQGRMCIVNWRGDVLEDSAGLRGANLRYRPEARAALHGRAEFDVRDLDDLEGADEPTAYAAVPMLAKGNVTGAIYAERSLSDLQLVLQHLRELLYQVAVVTLCVAVVLSLVMADWLTRPVRRLARAATRLGEGHLDERIPQRGRDEIGALAGSFNAMAESLQTQQDRLLQFVSDSSHELKTPLASLRSVVDALEGGALDEPELRDRFITYIHGDLDRMDHLVKDLLQLHKIDQEVLRIELQPIELGPWLVAWAKRHAIEVSVGPGLALADPDRLGQVIDNLLANARRAVRDGGVVRLRQLGSQIRVEDTGVGLTTEQLGRVFDRFYRVDTARTREDGGTGLGLTITRGLVEAMGGTLTASSPGMGLGATFQVTLRVGLLRAVG